MERNNDWEPELYLKFRNERTRPVIDLVNRISTDFIPEKIIDIGCGPGNSSQKLVRRWPSAYLVGIDSSSAMIEKAKADYPDQEWIIADGASYNTRLRFDVVFSNSAIQWIPNHEHLLDKFHELLTDKGILAVQIPLFWDMPAGKALAKVTGYERWKKDLGSVSDIFTIHDNSFYYDQLSKYYNPIEIWQTDYMHILGSWNSIMEMIRSTALKPYLETLKNETVRIEFEDELFNEIKRNYPLQGDGKVLFPFRRLFFIGYK